MGRWRAAWQGHLGWVRGHDVPKPTRYVRELFGDAQVRRLGRACGGCVAAGFVLPALAGWAWLGGRQGALSGASWGGVVRLALGHHVIRAINSWCHLAGTRGHHTPASSTNVGWLARSTWGESWRNKYHAAPTSARLGSSWLQPDIGWRTIRFFVALGWALLRPTASAFAPVSHLPVAAQGYLQTPAHPMPEPGLSGD